MAGTTPKGLRYPTAGDTPAVHVDIKNLADDVDADLDDYVLKNGGVFTANPTVPTAVIFEGATDDSFELTLQTVDPTADRTILLPDQNGTVALASDIIPLSVTENHARATALMLGGM
jgi:hypothetical protein